MKSRIEGAPAFAHLHLELAPGETLIAESDAMASMDSALDMVAKTNGGFFKAIAKKFFGGESFFVNHFTNSTEKPCALVITQGSPGEMRRVDLSGDKDVICLQPGAYIASTPGLQLGVQWAGFASGIAREGFFRLRVSGQGTLWYGAFGGLLEKQVEGEYIVDTGHLVAYPPHMKLKLQLAGGLLSSLFGGEGLVTRVEGYGKITLQSRSLSGLAGWLNPKLW